MLDLECPVTFEPYSEALEHQPRILPCGHTVSAAALRMLLALPPARQICPTDRTPLGGGDFASYPVNYTVLELVRRSEADLTAAVDAVFRKCEAERGSRPDPNQGQQAGEDAQGALALPPGMPLPEALAWGFHAAHDPYATSPYYDPNNPSNPIPLDGDPHGSASASESAPLAPTVTADERRLHRLRLRDEIHPRVLSVLRACYPGVAAPPLATKCLNLLLDLHAETLLAVLNVPTVLYLELASVMRLLRSCGQIEEVATSAHEAEPANWHALEARPLTYQQQHLGQILHAQLDVALTDAYPGRDARHLTAKVTGMLLATYSSSELVGMLEMPEDLFQTLADALLELQRHFLEPLDPSRPPESADDTRVRQLLTEEANAADEPFRDCRLLGEWLFPLVLSAVAAAAPAQYGTPDGVTNDESRDTLAQKVTGMLLQSDAESVLHSIADAAVLEENVAEALAVLNGTHSESHAPDSAAAAAAAAAAHDGSKHAHAAGDTSGGTSGNAAGFAQGRTGEYRANGVHTGPRAQPAGIRVPGRNGSSAEVANGWRASVGGAGDASGEFGAGRNPSCEYYGTGRTSFECATSSESREWHTPRAGNSGGNSAGTSAGSSAAGTPGDALLAALQLQALQLQGRTRSAPGGVADAAIPPPPGFDGSFDGVSARARPGFDESFDGVSARARAGVDGFSVGGRHWAEADSPDEGSRSASVAALRMYTNAQQQRLLGELSRGSEWTTVATRPVRARPVDSPPPTAATAAAVPQRADSPSNPASITSSTAPSVAHFTSLMDSATTAQYCELPETWLEELPQRPGGGVGVCEAWMAQGACWTGAACPLHHPIESGSKLNNYGLPMRIGATTCYHFTKSGKCDWGAECKFHHPDIIKTGSFASSVPSDLSRPAQPLKSPARDGSTGHAAKTAQKFKVIDDTRGYYPKYKRKPGAEVCTNFQRSGYCRYPDTCTRDHPPQFKVKLNLQGYPLRPKEPVCKFYVRQGHCHFITECTKHHPNLEPC